MEKVIREMLKYLFADIQRRKEEFRPYMDGNIWFMRDSFLLNFVDFKKTVVFEIFFKFHIQHVPFNDYCQEGYKIHIPKLLNYIILHHPFLKNHIKTQINIINDEYVSGNFWVDMDYQEEDENV